LISLLTVYDFRYFPRRADAAVPNKNQKINYFEDQEMSVTTVEAAAKGHRTRYLILLIIFIVTAVNYADRATLSIAGSAVGKELHLSAMSMGYIFSAFGWAYLLMQIPGGWLLDRFGSKKVYTYSLFFWSLFTFLQGFVHLVPLAWAAVSMFAMRFMLGFAEAPLFPGQCAHRRRLVPDQRARHRLRDF
jgi:sugar phosphate permease